MPGFFILNFPGNETTRLQRKVSLDRLTALNFDLLRIGRRESIDLQLQRIVAGRQLAEVKIAVAVAERLRISTRTPYIEPHSRERLVVFLARHLSLQNSFLKQTHLALHRGGALANQLFRYVTGCVETHAEVAGGQVGKIEKSFGIGCDLINHLASIANADVNIGDARG